MKRLLPLLCLTLSLAGPHALAARVSTSKLSQQLEVIRVRVIAMQKDLLGSLKTEKQAQSNLHKIRALMRLQQEEREIGRKRIEEFEHTVQELDSRRKVLTARIAEQQHAIRDLLITIEKAKREEPKSAANILNFSEVEKIEAPRRRVLANLVTRSLREISAMKADLNDAEKLGNKIIEEKQQLAYLFQDLDEKESVLELNRQLQADILRKNHDERVAQLENYRKLKSAEAQVEDLIRDFSARVELEKTAESDRAAGRALAQSEFMALRGKLPSPIAKGRVLSVFGRAYDPRSKLYVFKKGIDIEGGKKIPVRAIFGGKIAYSGVLPDYGQVTILDHGDHFYSLCAHLGELTKKAGETVAAGDAIGATDDSGTPVYFEIRARNVAVNPLQWISN